MSILKSAARQYMPKPLVGMLRARRFGIRFLMARDFYKRLRLLGRIQEISDHLICEHSEPEAILVASKLLALPDDVQGDIIECGCYLGGSTAKLSLTAKARGRRLIVFDSFMGLPDEGGESCVSYKNVETGRSVKFRQGDYAASLEQVKQNIFTFGESSVVDFIQGFFQDTMPYWQGRAAAIVLDVDLVESTKTCLRYLWPRLSPGGVLFSQDGHLSEICDLLNDKKFWAELGEKNAPKFIGLGKEQMVYAFKKYCKA
ncbi:MAG: TylF/MycF/NovP-related O-methyltransferase [Candidatus Aminicenantales bacterium]